MEYNAAVVAREISQRWGNRPENIIEMMHDIQTELNYLPKEVLYEVSSVANVPISKIYNIATFYNAFSLKPKGKHRICVCLGTPCYALGAPRVIEAIEREIGVKCGETTPDMKFSLEISGCVGTCGLAPVVIVGEELYGPVPISEVPKLIKKYASK